MEKHKKRIALSMDAAKGYGWGLCAWNLATALKEICDVRIVSRRRSEHPLWDPQAYDLLNSGRTYVTADIVIHAMAGTSHLPVDPMVRSSRLNIGYTFFELDTLAQDNANIISTYYDAVAFGSSWNAGLCSHIPEGPAEVPTTIVLQGIDHEIFRPDGTEMENRKALAWDHLLGKKLVFSGGKFEFRKGQDLVMKAFQYLKENPEIHLIAAWDNAWPESAKSMENRPHINFKYRDDVTLMHMIERSFHDLGVDRSRYTLLNACSQKYMNKVYNACDFGVFPNRAEGGTNLVMMEFMACGKPVITSNNKGHGDIFPHGVTDQFPGRYLKVVNCIQIKNDSGFVSGTVDEFDPRDIAQKILLETASPSNATAESLRIAGTFTWAKTAEAFLWFIDAANL